MTIKREELVSDVKDNFTIESQCVYKSMPQKTAQNKEHEA